MLEIKETAGAEAILPYYYGGSNGLLTQNTNDAELWRRFGTSRLATTICAAPTGAANLALYGKMPTVVYQDYPPREADHPVGRQSVGVGHPPHPLHQGGAGGRRDARRDRSADDVAREEGGPAPRACGPAPTCRSRWRCTGCCSRKDTPTRRFSRRTRTAPIACARRPRPWTIERAAAEARDRSRGAPPARRSLRRSRRRRSSAAAGASSATATAAAPRPPSSRCPSVGGKFGVRGGGYSMSNSLGLRPQVRGSWIDTPEPATRLVNMNHLGRALLEYTTPPVNMLFVYNCNPLTTAPGSEPRARRAEARRPLHGRLRAGLHRHRALRRRGAAGDDVPRALRHRQGLRSDHAAAGAGR